MMTIQMRKFFLVSTLLLVTMPVRAGNLTTYTYQGLNFGANARTPWTAGDSISGSITLDFALGPNYNAPISLADIVNYSFTDGLNSYDPSDSIVQTFSAETNTQGNIEHWQLDFEGVASPFYPPIPGSAYLSTQNLTVSGAGDYTYLEFYPAGNFINAYVELYSTGDWAMSASPEPSAFGLTLAALTCIGAMARRRTRLGPG